MEPLALSVDKSAVNFGETVVFSISNSTGQDLNQNAYITIQTGEQYSTSVLWNNQVKQYSFTLSFLRPEWGADPFRTSTWNLYFTASGRNSNTGFSAVSNTVPVQYTRTV